jgi:uncharacterized protein with PIN domain
MGFIQKLLMSVFPRNMAAKMKAESEDWTLECPSCKHEVSIWEIGGIRYKATNKSQLWSRCPGCRKYGWMRLYRKSSVSQAASGIVEQPER